MDLADIIAQLIDLLSICLELLPNLGFVLFEIRGEALVLLDLLLEAGM